MHDRVCGNACVYVCVLAGYGHGGNTNPEAIAPCRLNYTIARHDTCVGIARAANISVPGLKTLNPGLNCSRLFVGRVLCTARAAAAPPPPGPTPLSPGASKRGPPLSCTHAFVHQQCERRYAKQRAHGGCTYCFVSIVPA